MRVTPRVWIGFAIFIGYVFVIYLVTTLSGVPFPKIGTSAETTWRGAVLDLSIAAVLLAITTSLLGWWRPALFERKRSHHTWPIFVPIIMFLAAIVNLFTTDWTKFDASFVLSLIALGVFVGFCEELMSRGLVLTSFRSRLPEVWAWLLTTLLFGGMHLVNAALGAPLSNSLAQAGLAAMSGTAFYILRRTTGSLIWAMVLHGLWDARCSPSASHHSAHRSGRSSDPSSACCRSPSSTGSSRAPTRGRWRRRSARRGRSRLGEAVEQALEDRAGAPGGGQVVLFELGRGSGRIREDAGDAIELDAVAGQHVGGLVQPERHGRAGARREDPGCAQGLGIRRCR